MTDRTPSRGYAYPECNRPTVKDRSDIGFTRDLAIDVDADTAALSARIQQLIEKPDAARLSFVTTISVVKSSAGDAIFIIPYTATTYAQPAAFADLAASGLRVQERGFYLVTSYVRCTDAGLNDMQVRHLRNGLARTEGRRFEGPSFPVDTSLETSMETMDLMYAEAGDLIRTQVKMSPIDGVYTFDARLAAIQVLPLDI